MVIRERTEPETANSTCIDGVRHLRSGNGMPENILNQYKYQGELRRGTYGWVYKGVHM